MSKEEIWSKVSRYIYDGENINLVVSDSLMKPEMTWYEAVFYMGAGGKIEPVENNWSCLVCLGIDDHGFIKVENNISRKLDYTIEDVCDNWKTWLWKPYNKG